MSKNASYLESAMAHSENTHLDQTSHPYITEITMNKLKMEQLQRPFAKSYTRLNNEQCDRLRKLYTELEGDPFHPLFTDSVFPIVLQILEYLPEYPKLRENLLSDLQQLVNKYSSVKPDKAVHAEHTQSNSKKRGLTRACTVPSDNPKKRSRRYSNITKTLPYERIMEVKNSQQERQLCAARKIEEPEGKLLAATDEPLSQPPYNPIAALLPIGEDQCLSQPIVQSPTYMNFGLSSNTYYDGLNLLTFP